MTATQVPATELQPGMYTGRKNRITNVLAREATADRPAQILCAISTRGARSGSVATYSPEEQVTIYVG